MYVCAQVYAYDSYTISCHQQKLEVSCKELTDKYNEVKSNYTHLQSELTRERENRGHKERELTDLQSRLHRQVKSEQRLMEEVGVTVT